MDIGRVGTKMVEEFWEAQRKIGEEPSEIEGKKPEFDATGISRRLGFQVRPETMKTLVRPGLGLGKDTQKDENRLEVDRGVLMESRESHPNPLMIPDVVGGDVGARSAVQKARISQTLRKLDEKSPPSPIRRIRHRAPSPEPPIPLSDTSEDDDSGTDPLRLSLNATFVRRERSSEPYEKGDASSPFAPETKPRSSPSPSASRRRSPKSWEIPIEDATVRSRVPSYRRSAPSHTFSAPAQQYAPGSVWSYLDSIQPHHHHHHNHQKTSSKRQSHRRSLPSISKDSASGISVVRRSSGPLRPRGMWRSSMNRETLEKHNSLNLTSQSAPPLRDLVATAMETGRPHIVPEVRPQRHSLKEPIRPKPKIAPKLPPIATGRVKARLAHTGILQAQDPTPKQSTKWPRDLELRRSHPAIDSTKSDAFLRKSYNLRP